MAFAETLRKPLVNPSSSTLDFHLSELEEECARFVALVSALRTPWESETREALEGDLYASLFHIKYHVQPALKEWDCLTNQLPDDDEEDNSTK
jgi:hypothetical protein